MTPLKKHSQSGKMVEGEQEHVGEILSKINTGVI